MRLGRGTYPVGVVDRGVDVISDGTVGPRVVDGRERARGRRRGERRERDGDAGESGHRGRPFRGRNEAAEASFSAGRDRTRWEVVAVLIQSKER